MFINDVELPNIQIEIVFSYQRWITIEDIAFNSLSILLSEDQWT